MYREQFYLDMLPDVVFQGYTTGDHWNGWATPYFPKDSADQLMAAMNAVLDQDPRHKEEYGIDADAPVFRYDEDRDEYLFAVYGEPGEFDTWSGTDITVDGETVHVYSIGAYAWTWIADD